MKKNYLLTQPVGLLLKDYCRSIKVFILSLFFIFANSYFAYADIKNEDSFSYKTISLTVCIKDIGNGLYSATFGYNNPNYTDIEVDEADSYLTFYNGITTTVKSGLNKFKKGIVEEAFTVQFMKNDKVIWKVTSPNGMTKSIKAYQLCGFCQADKGGFIFPLFGQGNGKASDIDIYGQEGLALSSGTAGDSPSEVIFQLNENKEKVLIEIVPKNGNTQQTIDLLQNTYGVQVSDFLISPSEIISMNLATIDVYFPILQLDNLNLETTTLNFIRIIYPSFQNKGIVTTQGDSIQRSSFVRDSFRIIRDGEVVPVDGVGIKTGVISDSYDTQPFTGISKATIDVQNGDLPGFGNPNLYETPVEVLKEYAFGIASDEGRAMLQIIHDVAPGASLGFYSGILSPREFEVGIDLFSTENYNIIVDDITFITEPFFGGGRISQAIQTFTSLPGRTYFSSAGNFSDNGYQGVFSSSSASPVTNFLPSSSLARAHVFGTNPDGSEDILQKISVVPGTYMIVLQWDENIATQDNSIGAITDLDIYIVDDSGNLIVGSNRVNEAGDPTEIIVFQSTGTGEANILITSANGAPVTGLPIRYIAFRSDGLKFLEYGGAPTTSGHAMSSEANIIAAVDIRDEMNPEVQFFSSQGGAISNGFVSEIDFSAPNGVFTNVASVGQFLKSGDIFTSFFGTSASAPHAAAGMALFMSVQSSWYPDGLNRQFIPKTNSLADQAIQLFKQTATPTGDQDLGGAGFINIEKVFKTVANQTPKLLNIILEEGKVPGIETVGVTILGEYFLSEDETKVIFDGKELDVISITDTEIVVQVDPFIANPCLIVNTIAKTPGGTDGGDSNCLQLLEDGKLAINIIADDLSIEFGQESSFSFHVEGLPESVTYESTGLPVVSFTTPAVFPYPDVNNYMLTPKFDLELTEEQLASYQVNFVNSIFSVTKNDLTISPLDATYTYGDAVEVILNYEYNDEDINDSAAFLELIQSSHQSDFYPENTLILINKLRAVVNEQEILNLLNQGSWMSSERTIQNKLRAVVNEMNLIDLEPQHFQDFIDAITDPETNKLRAVVNKLRAVVNGQDLIDNRIDLVIENKLRAVVNGSGLGDENDKNDYTSIFAIIDAEDASTETEERTINTLYSMNLITGLEVIASTEESHLIFPGAFLNSLSANFNIIYGSGNITFLPKTLISTTEDIEIVYGDVLTSDNFTTLFEGFAYTETREIVFPDGIQYYIVNSDGIQFELGNPINVGEYEIKIRNPQNYNIDYSGIISKLTVNKSTLKVTTNDLEKKEGEIISSSDFSTSFEGFRKEDNVNLLFPDGIPYFFVNSEGKKFVDGDTGIFDVFITENENYIFDYIIQGKLTVSKKEECGECEGQITSLDLKYLGAESNATINIYKGKVKNVNLFKSFSNVNYGDILSFVGSKKNGKMGAKIHLIVSWGEKVEIHTSCSKEIHTGMVFGDFLIIDGTSYSGGDLCSEEDHKDNDYDNDDDDDDDDDHDDDNNDDGNDHHYHNDDENNDDGYKLYPNPVRSVLKIENNTSKKVNIAIFNMYGVQFYQGKIKKNRIKNIQVSSFVKGVYIVKITSKKDVKTYSIIKN